MRSWLRLCAGIDAMNRLLARAVAWLTLAMVLIGAYNAIARSVEREFGAKLSHNSLYELQWYLFGLVFLLGAPYALRKGSHVRVDVLYGGHSERGRAWIDLAGGVLFLIPFCVFAVVTSWDFVATSIGEGEVSNDPGGLARWPIKVFVPLAFGLLALQGVSEVVKRIALLRGLTADEVGLRETPLPGEHGAI